VSKGWHVVSESTVNERRYYTEKEFCELMRISRKTAFEWRKKKLISFVRTPTGIIRYRLSDIEAYERRNAVRARGDGRA
jgi:predicted site-specific integrase-resolvase